MFQRADEPAGELLRWVEILKAWQASGLSQAEYCRREGLSASTLSRWRRRLQAQQSSQQGAGMTSYLVQGKPGWIEVSPSVDRGGEGSSRSPFEVVVRGDRRIRLDSYFDAEGLRRLVSLLESLPC